MYPNPTHTNKQKEKKKTKRKKQNKNTISKCTQKSLSPKTRQGWGFTVHQGAITIREDGAASEVSTSTVTVEVEAVTLAPRRMAPISDSRSTHAIVLTVPMQDVVTNRETKGAQTRVACSTVPPPPSNTPGDALPRISQVICVSKDLKCCGGLSDHGLSGGREA